MKPIQMQRLAAVLALLVSPIALAGIADEGNSFGSPLLSTFLPEYGTGKADVLSQVYISDTTGEFIYTYVISGALVKLSFFSVGILPNAEINSCGWDADGNEPFAWAPVNNPYESIEALFLDPIELGETSATLWFKSPHAPAEADGALAGITKGGYNFLVGKVLTPQVPEPATWMLLVAGGLLSRVQRKKRQ